MLVKKMEAHYINQGIEKLEKGMLMFEPSPESFYLGILHAEDEKSAQNKKPSGYHIVHWDRTDTRNKRDAVKRIIDEQGNAIYENSLLPFTLFPDKKVSDIKT